MTTELVTAPFAELKKKIELREARVAVMGLGYVGLPLALLYTEQKFPVTGFDIDERKIDHAEARRNLHLPHSSAGDPGSPGPWL